jgi:4-hydroxybenzoyl-CoA thioesterase
MSTSPHRTFRYLIPIHFRHCDPAGIAYYPNYFSFLNDAIEVWFTSALGVKYYEFYTRRELAIPTVRLECEFTAPCRMGDQLALLLSVHQLGRSSLQLSVRLEDAATSEVRATMECTLVFVSTRLGKAAPIPDDVRSAIDTWLQQP